ncbi:MAG: acetate--CoA ligase family protein [Chloroflexota bacterium]
MVNPLSLSEKRLQNLRRLLHPRHVAFVGGRSAEQAIEICRASGFQGEIWPVHPRYQTLAGLPVFPSVKALPEPPDATFLYVSRDVVADVVRDLNEMGAGGAICHAAGFRELESGGDAYSEALREAAGELAVIGPNSNGLLNYLDRLVLWPIDDHRPPIIERGVAIITQSGGVAFNYVNGTRSVPPAYVISTGNQTVVDVGDLIRVVAEDERVQAIGLFLEGINDAVGFSKAAAFAAERQVPIVALKAGRTEIGARMALTHTGSLASSNELYDALFQRLGIVRVHSLTELDETLKLLCVAGVPQGRRLAILTNSGATRTLLADLGDDKGIIFTPPSPPVAASLREQIPIFASVSNPLDYNAAYAGAEGLTMENEAALHRCFTTMIGDDYDMVLLSEGGLDFDNEADEVTPSPTLQAWFDATRERGLPAAIVSMLPEKFGAQQRKLCIDHGVAPLQGLDDAMTAIAAAAWLGEQQRFHSQNDADSCHLPAIPLLADDDVVLDEAQSKAALAAFGLPVPRSAVVGLDGVVAEALSYPVVVKALSGDVAHKSRLGGVRLGVRDGVELQTAVLAIQANLAQHGHAIDQFLVEEMVSDAATELIIGVTYNPRFGHALLLGLGGVQVERRKQPTPLLLPATEAMLHRYVAGIVGKLGLNRVTVAPIFHAVQAVASYVAANRHQLLELDVNPLIVVENGRSAIAVDGVIRLSKLE